MDDHLDTDTRIQDRLLSLYGVERGHGAGVQDRTAAARNDFFQKVERSYREKDELK